MVLPFLVLNFASAQQPSQAPSFTPAGIVNSASFEPGMSPGSFFTIFGENLAPAIQTWEGSIQGTSLPSQLGGVSVTVGGQPAYPAYVSPGQLNVLLPTGAVTGPAEVQVTTPQGSSSAAAEVQMHAPGFFAFWLDHPYVVATHSDHSLVARLEPPGPAGHPAQPGEEITLWGTGFGPTNPQAPSGQLFVGAYPLVAPNDLQVTIGGTTAQVAFAGVTFAGVWQISVVVPPGLPNGDHLVQASIGGVRTQDNAFIAVQGPSQAVGIRVFYRLDPWLISGTYGGGIWVSPPVLGPTTQSGALFTLETRAHGLGAQGQLVAINPQWIASDPGMVAVSPVQGNEVKITVQQAGQSSLDVTYQGVTQELLIKATFQGDALLVEIHQIAPAALNSTTMRKISGRSQL